MKRIILITGLLWGVVYMAYCQSWTPQDSVRLRGLLNGDGEVKLNPDVLEEINGGVLLGDPKAFIDRSWLDFDVSMPTLPKEEKKKIILTLRPYSANTRFDWDPVYQKKIKVTEDTWRGEPFRKLYKTTIPSNWAKAPFDPGPRNSVEQIEATGLRYNKFAGPVGNMTVGAWQRVGSGSHDLSKVFSKDFWNRKGRNRRIRTLEVLKAYGDTTTVLIKQPLKAITE